MYTVWHVYEEVVGCAFAWEGCGGLLRSRHLVVCGVWGGGQGVGRGEVSVRLGMALSVEWTTIGDGDCLRSMGCGFSPEHPASGWV